MEDGKKLVIQLKLTNYTLYIYNMSSKIKITKVTPTGGVTTSNDAIIIHKVKSKK